MSKNVEIGRRVCQECEHAIRKPDGMVSCRKEQWASISRGPCVVSIEWFLRWRGAPFRPGTFPREPMAKRCLFFSDMRDDE